MHDDVPVLKTQASTPTATDTDTEDSTLSGTVVISDGGDGAASTALSIAGVPRTTEGNRTTFEVEGGKLVVTDNGDGNYSYEYQPENTNASFPDRVFTITATDSDGDSVPVTITVKQDFKPSDVEPGLGNNEIVVDEGVQPQHGGSETHADNGSGSFIVDLHGEHATFEVGGYTITVTGSSYAVPGTTDGVYGVKLSNISASQGPAGMCTVVYAYAPHRPQPLG